jgi:hypothetical protein
MIRRGIHGLAEFDDDRLSLKILRLEEGNHHWAAILDEAWEMLERDPPKRIAVVVNDLPGEAERRKHHVWLTFVR